MHGIYEIFEVLPNGSPQRVTVISGLESAKSRLYEVANNTSNECFAADANTRQIVALLNVAPSKWQAAKHIFQISYDEPMGVQRAELLKSRGYRVMSVIGNEAAKVALSPIQHYDLFIIGNSELQETEQEMVLWLKRNTRRSRFLPSIQPINKFPEPITTYDRTILRAGCRLSRES